MRATVVNPNRLLSVVATLSFPVLTGCTLLTTATPNIVPGSAIAGRVYGGSIPILGAKVYLLAVNTTGYGGPGIAPSAANASVSLLNAASTGNAADTIGSYVLTAPATASTPGSFTVTGDYSCTTGYNQATGTSVALSGNEQIYLYALGGNPGTGSANAHIGLLAALGPCNSPSTTVTLNEADTVATAYAFAGFASDATHISSSGTALAQTNVANAFATVGNLVTISTGNSMATIPAPNYGTVPQSTLYALANILSTCVQSLGAGNGCNTLAAYAQSSGTSGTPPTDTATAAINLAHNPWPTAAGMTALYSLIPGTGAPFGNGLTHQPNDFTLAISYTGNGGNGTPAAGPVLAIDQAGNIWSPSSVPVPGGAAYAAAVKLSNAGGYTNGSVFSTTQDSAPGGGIAIDTGGDAWIMNPFGGLPVMKVSPSAGFIFVGSGNNTGVIGDYGGTREAYAVAIDSHNNVWIASLLGGVDELNNSGVAIAPTYGYSGGGLGDCVGIAIDASGNVWVANQQGYQNISGSLSELSSSGVFVSSTGYGIGILKQASALAIDHSGNVWVADKENSAVAEFSSAGSLITGAEFKGGGLITPIAVAVDGAGNIWLTNSSTTSISEFNSAGVALSPTTGYGSGFLPAEFSGNMAIDGEGNVWVGGGLGAAVTEFVGVATPVVTPIVANLIAPYSAPASMP